MRIIYKAGFLTNSTVDELISLYRIIHFLLLFAYQ